MKKIKSIFKAIISFFTSNSNQEQSTSTTPDSTTQQGLPTANAPAVSLPEKAGSKPSEQPKPEVVSGRGSGLLWYPLAVKYKSMKTKGEYAKGYPRGAIVHFTAGRSGGLQNAKDCIDLGISNGYAYMDIASTGQVVQSHPLNQWGYHAGESKWPGLGSGVSEYLVGIEMDNAGRVEKVGDNMFKTWFGTHLTANEVRYVTEKEWGCPTGYYHKYTDVQEKALIDLLVWLKKNDPVGCFNIDFILGHHEVAGLKGIGRWRKEDPGGSLSMPMPKLRELVKERCKGLGV